MNQINTTRHRTGMALALALAIGWGASACAGPATPTLADRYVALQVQIYPYLSEQAGLPGGRGRLPDLSPSSIARQKNLEAALWRDLESERAAGMTPSEARTVAVLAEALANDIAVRRCRRELWSLDHMFGWQFLFTQTIRAEPVQSADDRRAVLTRWFQMPEYLRQDRANLQRGLELGYSVPRSVVVRVIAQIDALLATAPSASPFASPALRSEDAAFSKSMIDLVETAIYPAMRRYRSFLQDSYLPRARTTVAVSDLPDGRACYEAMLRSFTTLPITPEEVYALGERTVARNRAEISQIGSRRFGSAEPLEVIARAKTAEGNALASPEEVVAFSKVRLAKNEAATRRVIEGYPVQGVVIETIAPEVTTGPPPHYQPEPDPTKPGRYVLPLAGWRDITRSRAEWLAVHEAVPGHHVQLSMAFQRGAPEPIDKVAVNAAFTEGWARYSESLAEEIGLYDTDSAKVERRAWPGHGQVLDVGVHARGWSAERAIAYLKSTGVYNDEEAAAMVDRIAVVPGQLTAYDTGAAEIANLRAKAEARLGGKFNLARFHKAVLGQGTVPLIQLRAQVLSWVEAEAKVQ